MNLKSKRILKANDNGTGYLFVRICRDSKAFKNYVHRLVATEFIEKPTNKKCVDHINSDKTDNRVNNLRWVFKVGTKP